MILIKMLRTEMISTKLTRTKLIRNHSITYSRDSSPRTPQP